MVREAGRRRVFHDRVLIGVKVNPIPPVRVVPVPGEQKFFETRDIERMTKRLEDARVEAWAGPGANNPVAFNEAWIEFLADSINEQVRMVAQATKRHLAERDARISALITAVEVRDTQIKRHAEHLQRLQTKWTRSSDLRRTDNDGRHPYKGGGALVENLGAFGFGGRCGWGEVFSIRRHRTSSTSSGGA